MAIVHSAYDWAAAYIESIRHVATLQGRDPDKAEANARERLANPAPSEPWGDDSGFESREDRDRDRCAVDYDAEMDRYERSRGL